MPNIPGKEEKYRIYTRHTRKAKSVSSSKATMPDGFCGWAWRDIYKDLSVPQFGGDFYPWVNKGEMITCCTDGIRPVSFKLERL